MESEKGIFLYFLICIGIFLIIAAVLMFLNETEEAQAFCDSVNGTYHFKYFHFCDGKLIEKYKTFGKEFWIYDINFSYVKNPVLNTSILN